VQQAETHKKCFSVPYANSFSPCSCQKHDLSSSALTTCFVSCFSLSAHDFSFLSYPSLPLFLYRLIPLSFRWHINIHRPIHERFLIFLYFQVLKTGE
jgi:hypothetical protein